MSVASVGEMLFGTDKTLTDKQRTEKAQGVYDAVFKAFPGIQRFLKSAQAQARKYGYVETILGRRRHIPDMQLPKYEFIPLSNYINPDIDPLNPETLNQKNEIPERIKKQLYNELCGYKWYGEVANRINQLYEEEHIKVKNNSYLIAKASRQTGNSIIQGSAAELTKLAILKLESNEEWKSIGGRLLIPVHDELICEVPIAEYKRGAEILKYCMESAGNFLPFKISCDVETTLRWYGLSYPCQYAEPHSMNLNELTPDEISWLQYCLVECEYELPVIPDGNEKPEGDATVGVNGKLSDELKSAILDYQNRYGITEEQFIEHIKNNVFYGKKESV